MLNGLAALAEASRARGASAQDLSIEYSFFIALTSWAIVLDLDPNTKARLFCRVAVSPETRSNDRHERWYNYVSN